MIAETTMTTLEVANRLAALCKEGKYNEAQIELYAEDAESIEPEGTPMPSVKGLEAIKQKGQHFQEGIQEVHGGYLGDPIVAGRYFSCTMGMDVTMKDGNRMKLDEVCVYKVENGKITSEEFFY